MVGADASSEKAATRVALYSARAALFEKEAEFWGKRSRLVSNLRGLCFGALVVTLIAAAFAATKLLLGVAVALALVFVGLIVLHARVLSHEELALRYLRVNRNAEARVTTAWHSLPDTGAAFQTAGHAYAGDLDLFGPGSVYQRFSVAHTRFGQDTLARLLMQPVSIPIALERQAVAKALAPELEYRQKLEAQALSLVLPRAFTKQEQRWVAAPDPSILLAWAESEPLKLGWLAWGSWLLPAVTLTTMTLASFGVLPNFAWALPLAVQVIALTRLKGDSGRVFFSVSQGQGVLAKYGPMLELLESPPVQQAALERVRERLLSHGQRPSSLMNRFARVVGWTEIRNNPLVYPLLNAVLMWDVHSLRALGNWQQVAGKSVRTWFEVLGEVEAFSSLAGIAHDNPDFAWPEFRESAELHAMNVGHPLLASEHRVGNDVELPAAGHALLITGSNMSGKSTLLRSLGVNQVLALAGAPVCADRFLTSDFVVRTSIRVSDSLEQGVSHFYAELRKLQVVVDTAARGEKVLFLLDEVLHGTNSEERQIGARWILAELLRMGAVGALSTHDSGLCELPATLMAHVKQVHFRETVAEDRMTFDYKLRPGPVQGGNALRLMRVLGLNVPLQQE